MPAGSLFTGDVSAVCGRLIILASCGTSGGSCGRYGCGGEESDERIIFCLINGNLGEATTLLGTKNRSKRSVL